MKWLVNNFLKGSLVLVPIVVTAYAVWWVVWTADRLVEQVLPLPMPGLGLVLAVAGITAIGAVASNVVGRRVVGGIEWLFRRLPVVRLLYDALKDFVGAFVGDKRGFDRPALVELAPGVRVLGFVTCEAFDDPRLSEQVAVYLPQSYNFAGNLVIVPRDRVQPIVASGPELLAFVVSGGVAGLPGFARGARSA